MRTAAASDFATLLKSYREAAGFSQGELAERARMSRSAISALERGLNRKPHKDTVRLLADALQLAPPERAALETARVRGHVSQPLAQTRPKSIGARGGMTPLVGRARELTRLGGFLACEGLPLLLLAGEPGIGKSRLLHETARQAEEAGWSVLRGTCPRAGAQQPYAPVLDALTTWIRARSPAQLRADLTGCGWLVRVLPELTGRDVVSPPLWSLPPDQERRLLCNAVRRFLTNVAGSAGTLLVLDDLQWAGPDALMLLGALSRAPGPVRIVGAYRTTDVDTLSPLATLFADLGRDVLIEEMEIGPLAPADAEVLVEALLEQSSVIHDRRRVTQALVERGGGVPFFLVSCARAVIAGGDAPDEPADVPRNVRQSIDQRLAALSKEAQELLAVVAVMGRPVQSSLLESLAMRIGLNVEQTFRALDAAVHRRLLLELGPREIGREAETRYAIAHDLIRDVILGEAGATQRGRLSRVAGEVLEEWLSDGRLGQDATPEVMWHFTRAGEKARALPYALLAGEHAAAVHAYSEALRHYQTALELARDLGDAPHQAEATLRLGQALHRLGRPDAAMARLAEAARLYLSLDDRNGAMHAVSEHLLICAERGSIADGLHLADPLLAATEQRAEPATRRAQARLYNGLTHLYFMSGRYERQLEAAALAEQLAREAEDDHALATALYHHVLALWNTRSPTEMLPRFLELIPRIERTRDAWLLYRALNSAAEMLLYQGEFAEGRTFQERALEVAERFVGEPSHVAFELGNSGNYAFYLGEWAQARERCERALAMMRQVDPRGVALRSAYVHLWVGKLDLVEGHLREGEEHLERSLAIAGPGGDLQAQRHAQAVLAERDLLSGQAIAALARLQPILDRPALQEPNVTMRLLPLLAWAELTLDHVAESVRVISAAIARAEASKAGFALVDAWRVRAMIDIRQQRWTEAAASLDGAISLARTMPYPYAEAKALYVYALLDMARGKLTAARSWLEAASRVLGQLGEHLYAARVEARLTELLTS